MKIKYLKTQIVLGAEYLSYVKSIETHACGFLTLNILSIGTVLRNRRRAGNKRRAWRIWQKE
jgi:hypothetical protein